MFFHLIMDREIKFASEDATLCHFYWSRLWLFSGYAKTKLEYGQDKKL